MTFRSFAQSRSATAQLEGYRGEQRHFRDRRPRQGETSQSNFTRELTASSLVGRHSTSSYPAAAAAASRSRSPNTMSQMHETDDAYHSHNPTMLQSQIATIQTKSKSENQKRNQRLSTTSNVASPEDESTHHFDNLHRDTSGRSNSGHKQKWAEDDETRRDDFGSTIQVGSLDQENSTHFDEFDPQPPQYDSHAHTKQEKHKSTKSKSKSKSRSAAVVPVSDSSSQSASRSSSHTNLPSDNNLDLAASGYQSSAMYETDYNNTNRQSITSKSASLRSPSSDKVASSNSRHRASKSNASPLVASPVDLPERDSPACVEKWLQQCGFDASIQQCLSGYNRSDLSALTKSDLKDLIGVKEGIRLYHRLRSAHKLDMKAAHSTGADKSSKSIRARTLDHILYNSYNNGDADNANSHDSYSDSLRHFESAEHQHDQQHDDLNQTSRSIRQSSGPRCSIDDCSHVSIGCCATEECHVDLCAQHGEKSIFTSLLYCPACSSETVQCKFSDWFDRFSSTTVLALEAVQSTVPLTVDPRSGEANCIMQ